MMLFLRQRSLRPLGHLAQHLKISATTWRSMANTHASSWQKIGPRQYRRPLDAIERSLNQAYEDFAPPGFRSQDVLTTARIALDSTNGTSPSSIEELARRAWARVSCLHPAVASSFHGDSFIYSVPENEDDIQEWLDRSFVVKEQLSADSGFITASSSSSYQDCAVVPPASQPALYFFRRDNTFALRCPHIYTDGTGTLYLLQDFLTELSSLLGGDKAGQAQLAEVEIIKNLPQSTMETAKIPKVSTAEMQSLLPRVDLNVDQEAIQLPKADISPSSDPGPGRLQSLRFSVEDTGKIIQIGKQTGMGFTALVQAAILHAGQQLSGNRAIARKTHTTLTGFKIRDRCLMEHPNAGQRAFITRASLWPFHVHMGAGILETAANLKAEYATLAAKKDAILAASVPFMQDMLPVLAQKMDASFFAAFPGDLTSVIPRQYGCIQLQELSLCLITTTPMMLVVVQSFDGRMEVKFSYSAASRKDEEVDRFLQLIRSGLTTL